MSSESGSTCHSWLCCFNVRSGDAGCRIGFCGCHADCGEPKANVQPTGSNLCSLNLLCCGVRSQRTRTIGTTGTTHTVPHTQPPPQQQMSHQPAQQPASSSVVTGYPQQPSAPAGSGFEEPLKPARNNQYPAQMTNNTYQ